MGIYDGNGNAKAAAYPLSGSENIPASTGLSGGAQPQDEVITPDQLNGFGRANVAIAYAASITPDVSKLNKGLGVVATLTGNVTLANPTNLVAGSSAKWDMVFTQDGTGSRTLSFGTAYKKVGGAVALSTAAGSVDVVHFVSDGTTVYVTIDKAFS
ncbi:hypothetical protein [Tolumonas lignilytica]|uniref:hypothetical protein n=1 Tax=Tolumonas lignilytica TaxID=1283284 RepID=UPI0004656183|nr:hypothetical protein [Tolumonas lignilytica]